MLVSQPGIVRDATLATLGMVPGLVMVGTAPGALSATRQLRTSELDLVLTDANIPLDEVLALLQWTQTNFPALRVIVMTTTAHQRAQAISWGAHAAIQRAGMTNQLEMALQQLQASAAIETISENIGATHEA
ncbi:MAG: hypothetical protein KC487_15835 [Anaerolineae bacterium]|nr:hypothetical protein [Anaerolineae bacterium]